MRERRYTAISEVVGLLTRHRQLTFEMTKREIGDRYAGQVIGTVWAVGHPLAVMGVYVFVFAHVFKARMGGTRDLPLGYVSYLLAGLIPWMAFQESLAKSASVIVSNANLVKQVVFPIEILPVKGVLASLLTQVVMSTALVVYIVVDHGGLHWTHGLVPVLLVLQFFAMSGLAYALSSIGAYLRDLKEFVQLWNLIGMYLAPVAYHPDWVPEVVRPLFYLNPYSYMLWCYQDAIYYGRLEHPVAWGVFPVGAVVAFFGGYAVFRRLKVQFGNVL